jgi:hypothetical protein
MKLAIPQKCPSNCQDLAGTMIGALLVVAYVGSDGGHGARWIVQCACGRQSVQRTNDLRSRSRGERYQQCWECRGGKSFPDKAAGKSGTWLPLVKINLDTTRAHNADGL